MGDLELQQAFLDVVGLHRPRSRLTLRLGRQELPLGSGRLFSIRDGANVRLSFDAAKVTWIGGGRTTLEASAGRPVVPKQGVFESATSDLEWFWYGDLARAGAAASRPAVEFFYVGHRLRGALYGRGIGDETRHSVGSRVWGRPAPWDYSVQAGFQFGSFGSADILGRRHGDGTCVRFASRASARRGPRRHRQRRWGGRRRVADVQRALSRPELLLGGRNLRPRELLRPPPLPRGATGPDRGRGGGGRPRLAVPGSRRDLPGGRRPPRAARHARRALRHRDHAARRVLGAGPADRLRAAWVWATAGQVIRAAGGRHTEFLLLSLDLRL